MDDNSSKPYILAKYPNKALSREYPGGRLEPADRRDILSARLSGDPDHAIRRYDHLYKDAVRLCITSLCNCQCLHCFEGDQDGKMSGSMSLEDISRILDECLELGIKNVDLSGGEPFVHPQFREILCLIKQKDMTLYAINTNGMLIDDSFLALLKELDMDPLFCVSFDGIGTHDTFRGIQGMEKAVLKNMELLKNSGYHIHCNINVNRITRDKVVDTARFVAKNFRAVPFLIRTSPSPRWVKACPDGTLSYEEYYDVCLDVIKADIEETWGVPVKALHMPTIPSDLDMKQVFDIWHRGIKCPMSKPLMSHCPKGNYLLTINHDGRVLPCQAFAGYSESMGFLTGDDVNVFKRPIKDILTDSQYRKIYDLTLKDLTDAEPECRECRWLNICRGGCRILSLENLDPPAFNRKSKPSCIFFKGGYAKKLEELF